MKINIFGLPQRYLVELCIDIVDAAILNWFVDFYHSGKMAKVQDTSTGKEYLWVNYEAVIEDMPILGIKTRDGVYRRFQNLVKAGVFEHYTKKAGGTFSCYRIVESTYLCIIDDIKQVQLKKSLGFKSDSTDEHPDGYGRLSRGGTDGCPDQKIILNKDYPQKDVIVENPEDKKHHISDKTTKQENTNEIGKKDYNYNFDNIDKNEVPEPEKGAVFFADYYSKKKGIMFKTDMFHQVKDCLKKWRPPYVGIMWAIDSKETRIDYMLEAIAYKAQKIKRQEEK